MSYFGVYIPKPEVQATEDSLFSEDISQNYESLIFKEKSQALQILHKHKEARLREFPSREQAENYVQFGFESLEDQEQQPEHRQDLPPVTGERSSFHAPTKQELQQFRKKIEAGNLDEVNQILWENPRYLISSGDTPTCLKEGPRYNAMHICAQLNQPSIAELILQSVADPEFAQLYTDQKGSPQMCADLSKNLLDLYLNMPDKARGETPLHFAAKSGHVEVLEVLIGYTQCKSLPNREGKEPRDIICQRNAQASMETLEKLELLLGDPYYVPVLRSFNDELPPQVGRPYSPKEPPRLQLKEQESKGLSVKLTISALAGPMSRDKAMKFYRRWKTPPRLASNTKSPLVSLPFTSPVKMTPSKSNSLQLSRRMLFSQNQDINASQELPITPISLTEDSLIGDLTLELSMCTLNSSFQERHTKNSDIGKGLEVVGRELAHQEQLEWREYWHFLDSFVDIGSSKGLTQLEAYLQAKMEQARKGIVAGNFIQESGISQTETQAQVQMHQSLDEGVSLEDNQDDDFFVDCSSSSSEDSYRTVPEHPLFINGPEPTKCDLDVLNAIFNVDVDEKTLPHVHAWRTALKRFSTEEMELFSSPKNVEKTRKLGLDNNTSVSHNSQTSIHPKQLFGAPRTNETGATTGCASSEANTAGI